MPPKSSKKQKIKGIYTIRCKENNKVYVGRSEDIYKRWESHKNHFAKGNHQNTHMQQDWTKYSASAFEFAILHRWQSGENLTETEEIWIGHLKPQYNLVRGKRA